MANYRCLRLKTSSVAGGFHGYETDTRQHLYWFSNFKLKTDQMGFQADGDPTIFRPLSDR